MGGTMKSEKAIQNETLVEVTALPGVMAWRENSGLAWVGNEVRTRVGQMVMIKPGMKLLDNARPLRAGIPGIADVMGVARRRDGSGQAFALEIKDWEGQQEVSQVRFERAFTENGGLYQVIRDPVDAISFLRQSVLDL